MKLYKFNMNVNGHNIDSACTLLRLRWYDARDAGDYEAAKRIQARIERIGEVTGGCLNGIVQLPYHEWLFLHNVSEWYKAHRACRCEAAGIEYAE